MPHFAKASESRHKSFKWVTANQPDFSNMRQKASDAMIAQHAAEEAAKKR